MSYYDGFAPYVSVAEKKAKADKQIAKLKKKNPDLAPILLEGRTIAKSWWGRAWCDNLERYADYESRLDRGKRYVKTGAVIDLSITKGRIQAKVQGSRKTPYKVEIRISPLSEERCQEILQKCGKRVETLEKLLSGDFPEELKELFTQRGGLFPSSREISFSCSCPDWALMCKHVAAVLYGIGARLDENPSLFFELRGIEMGRFIDVAIANRVERMLKNAGRTSGRTIDEGDIRGLFGI